MALGTIDTNQIASEAVTVPKVTDQVLASPNLIINGAMEIFQRTTSVSSVSDNTYVVQDRMNFFFSNDGVISVFSSSEHPTGAGFSKSLKVDVTTADTSIAAAQYFGINQRIEGYNHARLEYGTSSAKSIVVSFYAKSNLTGPFCYSAKNGASDRSFPIEFSLSAANTWERISFVIPGDTSGTWLETNGIGAYHQISLAMGSNYQGTNNTWQAGNKVATSNQVNLLSSTSNEFFLTGWQVEVGTASPTAYQHEDYGTTLAKCQRYYYKIEHSYGSIDIGSGLETTTTQARIFVPFPVEMRSHATAVETSSTAGNFDITHNNSVLISNAVPTYSNANRTGASVFFAHASGGTAGQGCTGRLRVAGTYLAWKAEL
jgi:hypothetical protein